MQQITFHASSVDQHRLPYEMVVHPPRRARTCFRDVDRGQLVSQSGLMGDVTATIRHFTQRQDSDKQSTT